MLNTSISTIGREGKQPLQGCLVHSLVCEDFISQYISIFIRNCAVNILLAVILSYNGGSH
jgi:hypothetical protein